jgi:hypothetical protein
MGAEEKAKLLVGQKERLEHFAYEHVAAQFLSEMQRFMKEQ